MLYIQQTVILARWQPH